MSTTQHVHTQRGRGTQADDTHCAECGALLCPAVDPTRHVGRTLDYYVGCTRTANHKGLHRNEWLDVEWRG